MKSEEIVKLTDEQLVNIAQKHVEAYPNCSDCCRILEQLTDRFTKQRNIVDELTK